MCSVYRPVRQISKIELTDATHLVYACVHLCCGIIPPMTSRHRSALALAVPVLLLAGAPAARSRPSRRASTPAPAAAAPPPPPAEVRIYVTNETSGDLTVINGDTQAVIATAPLGKRPRGIQASPDGKSLYVALSGSPPAGPGVDPKTLPPPDRNADGIGEVDADTYKLKRDHPRRRRSRAARGQRRRHAALRRQRGHRNPQRRRRRVRQGDRGGEGRRGAGRRDDSAGRQGRLRHQRRRRRGVRDRHADQQAAQADPGRTAAAVDRLPARRLARLRLAREPGRDRGVRRQGAEVSAADRARRPGQHAEAAADGHRAWRRTARRST